MTGDYDTIISLPDRECSLQQRGCYNMDGLTKLSYSITVRKMTDVSTS